ncbi:Uncharacterised protein [Mycobacteroides abscessus]|nr:Uncharacterised protein [Mycobacteroides abscessus]
MPAGRSSTASFGFSRPVTTASPPARTSTAGAAATWRTVSRPWPAAVGFVSFVKSVAVGWPPASRCATAV